MLELIYQDEYGQRNIVARDQDWRVLEEKAKQLVSSENFDNALNTADQKRDFTVYYVEFFSDEEKVNAVYSGPKGVSDQWVTEFDKDDNIIDTYEFENTNALPNFYIGQFAKSRNEEDLEVFYAEGARNGRVNKFDAGELAGRGFYFIKV